MAYRDKCLSNNRKISATGLSTQKGTGQGVGDISVLRTALSMQYERSNQCPPKAPLCASCAQTMRLARITSRFDDLPDLYTFECRGCGVSQVEPALLAVKLDAAGDHQVPQKSSSNFVTLLGRLDAIEGNRLFRTSRKRLRQTVH
jgi:hypothetical protein